MTNTEATRAAVEHDIWQWIHGFVTVPNEFYHYRYAPCPYAKKAVLARTVDVVVWLAGDVRGFIRVKATEMLAAPKLTTRVMAFPPRVQFSWKISEFIDELNSELIARNLFLNTGVAKTTQSRYPRASANTPYFIVVANSLNAVLSAADVLEHSDYYKDWPAEHRELVVNRRARMAKRYGGK